MKKLLTMVLGLIALHIQDSFERKTFLVKEQHPVLLAPRVLAYDSSWRYSLNGYTIALDNNMQLVSGWDFTQKQGYYGSQSFKHWAFRNNYYVRTNFVLHPNVQLSTFYQGESYLEVP